LPRPNLTVVIGDAHAKPGVSNRRFDWLGRYLAERRPDTIIALGDWWDMPSLCSYDEGKKCFEGRRYKVDVAIGNDALARVEAPLAELNRKRAKARRYNPRRIMLGGNHDEGRVSKVVELEARLEGTISLEDFRLKESGWEYVPFLDPFHFEGIIWQHYFISGIMGRPIGGKNPALALIEKQFISCGQGHTHMFAMDHRTRPDGRRVWGIHAGCFLDPEQYEDYAGGANVMWHRGVLELENVREGDFDTFRWYDIRSMQRDFA